METGHTVLVIDDNLDTRASLRDALTQSNFRVLEAENGEQGLIISLKEHPDLIILDEEMPVMSGLTMLKQLRTDAWGEKAKVLVLTNNDQNEIVATALEMSVTKYLVKASMSLEAIVRVVTAELQTTH